ncbi:hypothetical protein NQ317_011178 [Molorchus minor]|uniref:Pyrroline-5-carboxylate reductase catalytic N-terminal domain-containing protein n=1 Tax=Molorchus minor TaxID=1323400 RepID=A0ABQ9JK31_9CUCU|nr:hypothetical protein NQ317_011178 [Molorchus minor]
MSSKLLKIGFIGGGKMAQAMAKGFISAGLAKGETMELGAETLFENVPVVEKSDIVIISVKPSIVPVALNDIKEAEIKADKLFLSIAMGVTIRQLEKLLLKNQE